MTRINTNVSSLNAQKSLGRANEQLQQALTRLSTGLRINSGKDDPAGLIASEVLRSDIVSVEKGISNSQRANQMIATADSALGQASSLLNDIRGLVTEAANEGAMSEEQIAANQLQVDSALESLNRISQTTTFQGRRLLDGSLDFITQAGAGFDTVGDLQLQQVNLGATGQVDVNVVVNEAATQALINGTVPAATTPAAATADMTFADNIPAVQASSTLTFNDGGTIDVSATAAAALDGVAGNGVVVQVTEHSGGGHTFTDLGGGTYELDVDTTAALDTTTLAAVIDGNADLTAAEGVAGNYTATTPATDATATLTFNDGGTIAITAEGALAGAAGDGILIQIAENAGSGHSFTDLGGGVFELDIDTTAALDTTTLAAVVDGDAGFIAAEGVAGNYTVTTDIGVTDTTAGGADAIVVDDGVSDTLAGGVDAIIGDDVITITADETGLAPNGVNFSVVEDNTVVAGDATAVLNGTDYEIHVNDAGTTTIAAIATAIDGIDGYSASVSASAGDGNYLAATEAPPAAAVMAGGLDTGGLLADLVVEVGGTDGSEVFQFQANTSLTQIVSAINLVSDATGVQAVDNGGVLDLQTTAYGTDAFVSIDVIEEGAGGTFETGLSATRALGTDINASVNGVAASGDGNTLSINTSTLDLTMTVDDGSSTDVSFNITGGGALFQLGPDVVTNQQARIGIQSLNSATLGSAAGRLFQLGSGQSFDLDTDANTAFRIVDDVISEVTSLRGRLGAFQRTTLETNIASLEDTLENLSAAQSQIRDADFAKESAALTRGQILVQSGTSVLSLANSSPQNVLALLR